MTKPHNSMLYLEDEHFRIVGIVFCQNEIPP